MHCWGRSLLGSTWGQPTSNWLAEHALQHRPVLIKSRLHTLLHESSEQVKREPSD
jgi:hypothetical protein